MSDTALDIIEIDSPEQAIPKITAQPSISMDAVAGILEIGRYFRDNPGPDVEAHHLFAKGLCARMIHAPAGCTIVSRVHKVENIGFLISGAMRIYSCDDTETEMVAPQVFVSKPGTLRMIVCHTDVLWAAVFPTGCNTEEDFELEAFEYAWTPEEYQRIASGLGVLKLEAM